MLRDSLWVYSATNVASVTGLIHYWLDSLLAHFQFDLIKKNSIFYNSHLLCTTVLSPVHPYSKSKPIEALNSNVVLLKSFHPRIPIHLNIWGPPDILLYARSISQYLLGIKDIFFLHLKTNELHRDAYTVFVNKDHCMIFRESNPGSGGARL